METNSKQQEILLVKNTSFSRRQLKECNPENEHKNVTPTDILISACWNGMISDSLPGLIDTSEEGQPLFMWDILQARSFLDIELCEQPQTIETEYSINPYAFLATLCYV